MISTQASHGPTTYEAYLASPELRRSVTTEPEAITYDVYMDNHRPPGCSSFCDEPEEPASCCGAVRRVCCPCCPGGRPGPYASQDSEDSTTDLVKPPRPARSRRSLGASPIGRRNSDVAALAMRRTGSEIDVMNFGACCDGSPVPAIGFDEAPRTP